MSNQERKQSTKSHNNASGINTIIFDIAGVLFEESKIKLFFKLGIFDTIRYTITHRKSLITTSFLTLSKMTEYLDTDPKIKNLYYRNFKLPQCITQWQEGTLSGQATLKLLKNCVSRLDAENFFASKLEKKLILKILELYLNAEETKDAIQPIKDMHPLVLDLKARGFKLYILSNQSKETFVMLEQQYPDFFKLFDGKVVSSYIHLVKPDQAIYAYILNTYHIDPARSVFIDDQAENLPPAHSFGITSILFTSVPELKKQFHKLNVL
jgi:putative hydrolase of the HAD superfamily